MLLALTIRIIIIVGEMMVQSGPPTYNIKRILFDMTFYFSTSRDLQRVVLRLISCRPDASTLYLADLVAGESDRQVSRVVM